MGDMYTMVLGRHPYQGALLASLGFESDAQVHAEIPRMRDVYLFPESIALLTRTGGGNREAYEEENQRLRDRPGFIREHDDAYDSTYAWWHYKLPEDQKDALLNAVALLQEKRPDLMHTSLEFRFNAAIEQIQKSD